MSKKTTKDDDKKPASSSNDSEKIDLDATRSGTESPLTDQSGSSG